MRNPTFVGQTHKTRALPFLTGELFFGLAVFVVLGGFFSLLIAAGAGVACILGLLAWRRSDAHRTDYFIAFLRRRFAPKGSYSVAERES